MITSKWNIRNSKYLLKHKYMTVRKDVCETKDGAIIDPYFVLEFPNWVQVVAFDKKNRILITRQYRHGSQKIIYGLPTGFTESSDKSILVSARRELIEETGYDAKKFAKAPIIYPNPAIQNNQVHTFAAFDIEKIKEPEFDHSERITTQFVTIKKLLKMIDTGKFSHALHVAGVMITLRKLELP